MWSQVGHKAPFWDPKWSQVGHKAFPKSLKIWISDRKGVQDTPKMPPRPLQDALGTDFGWIFDDNDSKLKQNLQVYRKSEVIFCSILGLKNHF